MATINGSNGQDTLNGTVDDDVINGLGDDDSLVGDDGNDSLVGGDGNDTLKGENDNDTLVGGAGADSLDGGGGIDLADYSASAAAVNVDLKNETGLGGDAEGDTIKNVENVLGSAFNDTLTGSDGANVLDGGAGDDSIFGGKGNDTLVGGAGADTIDGGDNNDIVDYSGSDAGVNINLATGAASGGHADGDVISNVEGVTGSDFNDTLTGNASNNTLTGGDGNDAFSGGAGNDSQLGGAGNDTFQGDAGNDTIDGGTGVDEVDYSTSTVGVEVDLISGQGSNGDANGDRYTSIENITGSDFNDTLIGDGADNVFDGGLGDDSFVSSAGADTLIGGGGNDTVDYSNSAAGVNVDLDAGTGTGGDAEGDVLSDIENAIGTAFSDTLIGNASDNELTGDDGADSLSGGAGNDTLLGGNDNDTLVGGTGADSLDGGGGRDRVDYSASATAVNVNLATGVGLGGDAQGDTLANIEDVVGSDFNDTITGGDAANVIEGGAGSDSILGGKGDDTIIGGAGADTIDGGDNTDQISYSDSDAGVSVNLATGAASGGHADGDQISNVEGVIGSAFDDTLTGDAADNTLVGGGGNDLLSGGAGKDSLLGGAGNDTFIGDAGDDTLNGGTGTDEVDYSGSGAGVEVNLVTGQGSGGDANNDRYTSIENVTGSDFSDTITGDGADNLITGGGSGDILDGGAGNDTLSYDASSAAVFASLELGTGGGGDANSDSIANFENIIGSDFNDSLVGDANDNLLSGGAGDDTLIGGVGADTLEGGTGSDTADYSASASGVNVDLNAGTASGGDATGDSLSDIEGVIGTDFDDTITGDASANDIEAGEGNDSVSGGVGNDTIIGGDNDDTIDGGSGDDLIYGDGTEPRTPLSETVQYSYAQDSTGNQATHFGEQGTGGVDDPMLLIDGDEGTEVRYHDGDIVEYAFGQELEAGTSITLIEGLGGEDTGIDVYVSFGSTDPNGDTLSGSGGGVGYENTVTNGEGILVYSGLSDSTVEIVLPINATHIQFVATGSHGGWSEMVLTEEITAPVPGDDSITGGDGNDTIDAGAGNDTVDGGAGNDSIIGAEGTDAIIGGSGNDTIDGGDQNDTIEGGTGADNITGGLGSDSIILTDGFGNDTIDGSEDTGNTDTDLLDTSGLTEGINVTFAADPEDGTLVGGTSGDTVSFSNIETITYTDQGDTVDGSASVQALNLNAGQGDDSLIGSAGNDTLTGDAGNDTLFGGEGADQLFGGLGDDEMYLAEGDTAEGGDGDDLFVLSDLGEAGSSTITITGGETGEFNGDTLQLTPDVTQADITFTNTDDTAGGLSGSFDLADGTTVTFSEIENIICFTPGARILTPHGERAIETLKAGDLVITRDNGAQPIRWIGRRTVLGQGKFAPIAVNSTVMDGARRPLLVSPQHRLLFTGYKAQLLFGESEVLVAAKHLVNGKDVRVAAREKVTYFHMMLDRHEVIYAEGAATETFHAGDVGISAISDQSREEMFAIFPELRSNIGAHGETARLCLRKHEARLLASL